MKSSIKGKLASGLRVQYRKKSKAIQYNFTRTIHPNLMPLNDAVCVCTTTPANIRVANKQFTYPAGSILYRAAPNAKWVVVGIPEEYIDGPLMNGIPSTTYGAMELSLSDIPQGTTAYIERLGVSNAHRELCEIMTLFSQQNKGKTIRIRSTGRHIGYCYYMDGISSIY